jgi:hypothetical protein
MKRDDPWFNPAMICLTGVVVGFAVSLSIQCFPLLIGQARWFVCALVAAIIGGGGAAVCNHVQFSHLRPFLRIVIEKRSSELEAIP